MKAGRPIRSQSTNVTVGASMQGHEYVKPVDLWRPGRLTKLAAFVIGGLFALLSITRPDGYGWMGSVLMSGTALIIPTLQFRTLWNQTRFWIVVAVLTAIQVPLVVTVRPLVEQYRALFLVAFGVGDGLFVILMIAILCSSGDTPTNEY